MDRASGHDRAAAGRRCGDPGSPAHPWHPASGLRERAALCRPAALRAYGAPWSLRARSRNVSREPARSPSIFRRDEFAALFRSRRTSIKAALLNQKLLHGVGNIYADESLFRAGIRPRRMACHLKRAELDRLHASLQSVLREAISLGGSSVSDYVDAAGVEGFFQLEHRVYLRTGLAMPGLRNSDPAHPGGRPRHPLLSPLPALSVGSISMDSRMLAGTRLP